MIYSRDYPWGDVAEDGENKKNMFALMCYVYTIENEYLIMRYYLVSVPPCKGGDAQCNCVDYNII